MSLMLSKACVASSEVVDQWSTGCNIIALAFASQVIQSMVEVLQINHGGLVTEVLPLRSWVRGCVPHGVSSPKLGSCGMMKQTFCD